MKAEKVKELKVFAETIRLETLKELKHRGFGHVGGCMSIVETMAALYGGIMKIDPQNPQWEERDWLVLSKGHAGPTLYATLALKGFFPIEELQTLNQPETNLPSHCDRNKTKGVDMTTGSLGQGISTAIGVALGNRLDKRDSYTYLIVGDGECDEGQIWEGALFAAHNKLDNLIAFVDVNKQQLDGYTKDVLDLGDLGEKFASFGWHVINVDGSDVEQIHKAVEQAKESKGAPIAIILDTKKGQGCTFAEDVLLNHHMNVAGDSADEAIEACEAVLTKLTE
ncbi:transketolase [Dethiobacter alkaliphilus]|uniref:transketolase n=1 Tax=Dethiobacter alkaliphilus TaxID=427926 RepID=UPI00222726CA|nr:transketolase [Dethiobacter alkaliphilus]MCW3490002.1 transketolase [Dethiobacter alkaliphilus]